MSRLGKNYYKEGCSQIVQLMFSYLSVLQKDIVLRCQIHFLKQQAYICLVIPHNPRRSIFLGTYLRLITASFLRNERVVAAIVLFRAKEGHSSTNIKL